MDVAGVQRRAVVMPFRVPDNEKPSARFDLSEFVAELVPA